MCQDNLIHFGAVMANLDNETIHFNKGCNQLVIQKVISISSDSNTSLNTNNNKYRQILIKITNHMGTLNTSAVTNRSSRTVSTNAASLSNPKLVKVYFLNLTNRLRSTIDISN